MYAPQDTLRPPGLAVPTAAAGTLLIALGAAALDIYPVAVLGLIIVGLLAVLTHEFLLRWEIQAALIVFTILLIPLGRYELPGNLPFSLEPYRVLVALIAAGWCASLLADPTMRWKPVGLFGPLLALGVALVASLAVNTDRIDNLHVAPEVVKSGSMFVSYWLVLMFVASVIRTREQLDVVVKALVAGGCIVAGFALVQYRTGFNIFDHLGVVPLLHENSNGIVGGLEARGGGDRVYASAQHPIALSAALVMLLPLGIYVARRYESRIWWLATAVIGTAAFSTVARTGSTMLLALLVVFLLLKPHEVLGLWKWAVPFLVVVHLMAPGALGGLKNAFFPAGGLVAEQTSAANSTASNRLADAGPALKEWWQQPYLGGGFGTRISEPDNPKNNAHILDDQWLGLLLETGLLGTLAFGWLLARSVRRLGRAARADPSEHGWLLAGLAAAVTAYAIGMITFDAFGFIQVTLLLFIMIGLSIPAIRLSRPEAA